MTRSLESVDSVRLLQRRKVLEIRDLDCVAMADDVAQALKRVQGLSGGASSVLNVRRAYGAEQTAILLVLVELADKAVATGRLRVGLINCRVRRAVRRLHCYHCFGSWHGSSLCGGLDRSKACRKCSKVGHFAAGCAAPRDVCDAFPRVLERSTVTKPMMKASSGDAKAAAENTHLS